MPTRGTWKIIIGADSIADYSDVVSRDPVEGGPHVQQEALASPATPLGNSATMFRAARGNLAINRSFKLTKEFADNKQSCDWFETAAQNFSGVADITFTHKDYAGVETSYKVSNASIKVIVQEPIGVTCQATIQVSGGAAVLQV